MAEITRTTPFLRRLFSTLSTLPDHHQFNAACISVKFYISCFFQRGFVAIFPHSPFAFLIASVLQFLQIKYQGMDKTPFDTHPIITNVGVASLLIYCFLYSLELKFSSIHPYQMHARKDVHCCMILAGSVSLASTTSILFPDSIGPVLFVVFFMLSAAELLHWIYCRVMHEIRELHNRRRTTPTQQISINLRRIVDRCFPQQGPILPLSLEMAPEE